MLPFHSRRRACGVLCATLFTSLGLSLFTTGCSQSVEESKAFQREVARAQRIDDDLRVTNAQLTEIKTQLETLTTSVGALQTAGGAPGGLEALKALEQRLIRLEANAAARGGAAKPVAVKAETPAPAAEPAADEPAAEPAETETIVAESRSTKQPVVELEAVEADEKVTVKKTSRKATSERKSGGERAQASRSKAETRTAAATSAGGAARTRAVGFYHKVQAGDDLARIASQYSVSLDSLQAANRVLTNRKLVAGQMVYVPARR